MSKQKKITILRKHVNIIHSDTSDANWSLVQRKTVNALLLKARESMTEAVGSTNKDDLVKYLEDTRGQEINYQIPISELKKDIKFDSNDHSIIKEALRGLVKTPIEYNIINSKGVNEWSVMALLSAGKLADGIVSFRFPSEIREELLYPSVYANIDLAIQNKLMSVPSFALYENVYRFINVGETPIFKIDTLKRLLGIKPESYPAFKDFNRQVIKKSVSIINRTSNIQIEVDKPKKEGKKTIGLRFKVSLKEKELNSDSIIELSEYEYALHQLGITTKQSKRIFDKLEIDDLSERITLIENTLNSRDDIQNIAAYAWTVLNADEKPKPPASTKKKGATPSNEAKLVIDGKLPYEDIERRANEELMEKLKDMYLSSMSSKRTTKEKSLHKLALAGEWNNDDLYNSFASFVESTIYIRRDLMKHLSD